MDVSPPVLAATLHEGAGIALAVVAAAFVGALVAGWLRVPKPAGYLLAGVSLGPAVLGWVDDRDAVTVAAEIGVALLLFSVGLELSLQELARTLRPALIIGLGQAVVVTAAIVGLGPAVLDVGAQQALVLGGACALSSTAAGVALVALPGGRGASLAPVAIGVLIVQDVLAVVIIALVPTLGAEGPGVAVTAVLGVALVIVGVIAVLPVVAALTRAAVHVLVARVDRELFLVAVLTGVGGAAAGAALVGLSPAIGAFVAGLLMRQSGYGHQALREVGGLRDVFTAVFFVSVGLLFDPGVLGEGGGGLVALLLSGAVVVKFAAIAGLAMLAGLPRAAAVVLAVLLANAGEFSFVVVEAADSTVLGDQEVSSVVFVVVVSLVLSSVVAGAGGRGGQRGEGGARKPVVVVGYGRLGRNLANALRAEGLDIVVVDGDAMAASDAKANGYPVVWGDARQKRVLSRLASATAVVVTPAGNEGTEVVEALADWSPGTRVVTVTMPPRPASLGLDLTVAESDRRAAADLASTVVDRVGRPVEPFVLRTAAGTMRFSPHRRARGAGRWRWLAEVFPWSGPRPGECRACRGSGRRSTWPTTSICPSCRGTGRAV